MTKCEVTRKLRTSIAIVLQVVALQATGVADVRSDFCDFYLPFAEALERDFLNVHYVALYHDSSGGISLMVGECNIPNSSESTRRIFPGLFDRKPGEAEIRKLLLNVPAMKTRLSNGEYEFELGTSGELEAQDGDDADTAKAVIEDFMMSDDTNATTGLSEITVPVALPWLGKSFRQIAKDRTIDFRRFAESSWNGKPTKLLTVRYVENNVHNRGPVNLESEIHFCATKGVCLALTDSIPDGKPICRVVADYDQISNTQVLQSIEKSMASSEKSGIDTFFYRIELVEFKNLELPLRSEKFRLSGYGLPEPRPQNEPPWGNYRWAIITLMVAIALTLVWRKTR